MKKNPYIFAEINALKKNIRSLTKSQKYLIVFLLIITLSLYYFFLAFMIISFREIFTLISYGSLLPSLYLFCKHYRQLTQNYSLTYRHLSLPLSDKKLFGLYLYKMICSPWGLYQCLVIMPILSNQLIYYGFSGSANYLSLFILLHVTMLSIMAFIQKWISTYVQLIIAWISYLIIFCAIIFIIYFLPYDERLLGLFANVANVVNNWEFNYPMLFTFMFWLFIVGLLFLFTRIYTVRIYDRTIQNKDSSISFVNKTLAVLSKVKVLNYGFFYKDSLMLVRSLKDLSFVMLPFLFSLGMLLGSENLSSAFMGNVTFLSLWLTSNATEKLIKIEKENVPILQGGFINIKRMKFEKQVAIISFVILMITIWNSFLTLLFNYNPVHLLHNIAITFFLSLAYVQGMGIKGFGKAWISSILGIIFILPIVIILEVVTKTYLLYSLLIIYNSLLIVLRRNYA